MFFIGQPAAYCPSDCGVSHILTPAFRPNYENTAESTANENEDKTNYNNNDETNYKNSLKLSEEGGYDVESIPKLTPPPKYDGYVEENGSQKTENNEYTKNIESIVKSSNGSSDEKPNNNEYEAQIKVTPNVNSSNNYNEVKNNPASPSSNPIADFNEYGQQATNLPKVLPPVAPPKITLLPSSFSSNNNEKTKQIIVQPSQFVVNNPYVGVPSPQIELEKLAQLPQKTNGPYGYG